MCDHTSPALDRRGLLLSGAGLAAGATVLRVDPATARAGRRTKKYVFEGEFVGPQDRDWHYLPFRVPKGVRRIDVSYTHEPDDTGAGISYNVVDIGLFDSSGHGIGNAKGFRGWSGGARTRFHLTRGKATPGYLAGPIRAGRWHVLLGPYQIQGDGTPYRVVVTLTFGPKGRKFTPKPAPDRASGRGAGWYRGDLHTHTVHSDGSHTQSSLVATAREAGLDLIGATDHNTSSATRTWGRHTADDLLVVDGEEVTTRSGHWLALGLPPGTWIDWRYRAEDDQLGRFTDLVHSMGGIAIAAHPFNIVPSIRWEHGYDYAGMDAVEVWNGPWSRFGQNNRQAVNHWNQMLVDGRFLPAVGSSDSHNTGQTVGLPQTAYRMGDLTQAELIGAVKGGHAWLAESSDVDLTLTARVGDGEAASCGDTLTTTGGDAVDVRLEATGVPGCFAVLYAATGAVGFAVADGAGTLLLEASVPESARYVRAEIGTPSAGSVPGQQTPVDKVVALTNPVMFSSFDADDG